MVRGKRCTEHPEMSQWVSLDLRSFITRLLTAFLGLFAGFTTFHSRSHCAVLPPSPAGPYLSTDSLSLLFFQVSAISWFPSQVTGNPGSITFKISTPVHTSCATSCCSLWHFRRISKWPTEDILGPYKPRRLLHWDPGELGFIHGDLEWFFYPVIWLWVQSPTWWQK